MWKQNIKSRKLHWLHLIIFSSFVYSSHYCFYSLFQQAFQRTTYDNFHYYQMHTQWEPLFHPIIKFLIYFNLNIFYVKHKIITKIKKERNRKKIKEKYKYTISGKSSKSSGR